MSEGSSQYSSQYSVGIDLGTTNSVLSFIDVSQAPEQPREEVLAIPQLTQPGVVESLPQLPSFLYQAHEAEVATSDLNLPWGQSGLALVGHIARHLGAGRIVVTARNTAAEADLRALGADVFIALGQEPDALQAALRAEIDKGIGVVLDYVWGSSAETIMQAATSHAPGEATQRIRFVNISSLGGLNINLPAGLLRSTGLELMGSGLSSVSNADLVRCIGEMFKVMRHIGLEIDAVGRPLAEVEQVWTNSQDRSRVVFTL